MGGIIDTAKKAERKRMRNLLVFESVCNLHGVDVGRYLEIYGGILLITIKEGFTCGLVCSIVQQFG